MDKSIYEIYKAIELLKIEISLEIFSIVKNQLDDLDFVVLKKKQINKNLLDDCYKEVYTKNYQGLKTCLTAIQHELSLKLFKFRCDKKWRELVQSNDAKIRFCTDCSKYVYLVKDALELELRSRAGQCTAVQFNFLDKHPEKGTSCIITQRGNDENVEFMGYIDTEEDEN